MLEIALITMGTAQLIALGYLGWMLNGRLTELLKTTKTLAHATGFKAGHEERMRDIDEAGRQVKN